MLWQFLVRASAWCIGVVVAANCIGEVMGLPGRKEGEGLDAVVRSVWIATLVGIPCLIVGLKGIRFGPEARKVRTEGLLCVLAGIGALLVSALLTLTVHLFANVFDLRAGLLTAGPLVIGLILIYAGSTTAISGVDIRAAMRHRELCDTSERKRA